MPKKREGKEERRIYSLDGSKSWTSKELEAEAERLEKSREENEEIERAIAGGDEIVDDASQAGKDDGEEKK